MSQSTLVPPPVSLLDTYEGSDILPLYTASVTVTGGEARHARASGRAVSSDGALSLDLRVPQALGGPGGGTNPEQLFAAGYAACFQGALSLIAAKRKIRLPSDVEIKADVTFGRDPADGRFLLTSHLAVRIPGLDAAQAAELIKETELTCPYAKLARTGMKHDTTLVA